MSRVTEIAERTVSETAPPKGPILEMLLRTKPKLLVCLGILQQSRRFLQGLLILADKRRLDTGTGMIRSILENMVTAAWILEGPDKNFEKFLGDALRRIRLDIPVEPSQASLAAQLESLMDTWVGHHEVATLPTLENRITVQTAKTYAVFRHLSATTHGSAIGATMQLHNNADDELEWTDPGETFDNDAHLALASALLCILAYRVFFEFGEEVAQNFLELHNEIMEVWFPDEDGVIEPSPTPEEA